MTRRGSGYLMSIAKILAKSEPMELVPLQTAAVAVIFGGIGREDDGRDDEGRLLLIRRSERVGDPWSGHIALPGGRAEGVDSSFRDTAVRETREEVGISLDQKGAEFLGYMGPVHTRTRTVKVVPCVFTVERIPAVIPSTEVAAYRWVLFREIMALENRSNYVLELGERTLRFPAFQLGDFLVWGVTERILSMLGEAVRPSPG